MYTKSWREAANLVQEPTARISIRFFQLRTASAAASAAGASLWRVHQNGYGGVQKWIVYPQFMAITIR